MAVSRGRAGKLFGVAALFDPSGAESKKTLSDVDPRLGIGVRAGGVVDEDRWVSLRAERGRRVGLNDLAHRHKKVAARALDVHLTRVRHRFDRRFINARCLGNKLWIGVHGAPLMHRPQGSEGTSVQRFPAAALSTSGSKGLLSPGQASLLGQDPYVARGKPYSKRWGFGKRINREGVSRMSDGCSCARLRGCNPRP